jgi:hypothetical protein
MADLWFCTPLYYLFTVEISTALCNGWPVILYTPVLLFIYCRDVNSTVSWLAQETASRYHKLTGLQCTLSIQLGDGSVLSPDDPITLLLASNEEVAVSLSDICISVSNDYSVCIIYYCITVCVVNYSYSIQIRIVLFLQMFVWQYKMLTLQGFHFRKNS